MKSKVITITNQKGGTGKTTTSLFLAYGLADRGKHVLVIDLDQQADATFSLSQGRQYNGSGKTSFELLTGETAAKDCLVPINLLIDLIPATKQLAQLDVALAQNNMYRADLLRDAIKSIKSKYDYVLIDTPPALSILITNALTASDYMVIPTQADLYSIKGLADLAQTIRQINNKKLKVAGILIDRYNARTVYSKVAANLLIQGAATLKTKVFDTKIREAIVVKEAEHQFKSIYDYSKRAGVTKDANNFVDELLEVIQNDK